MFRKGVKVEPFYRGNMSAMQDRQQRRDPAELGRDLSKAAIRSNLTRRRKAVSVTLPAIGARP